MGGIADYSGSLVLQLPIVEATLVALQKDPERQLTIVSLGDDREGETAVFHMPLADFEKDGQPLTYDKAEAYFKQLPSQSWAAYVAGVFLVLWREKGIDFPAGARIFIHSHVPEGKGVSSSAAVEVAVMTAVAAAFDITIDPRELALLCQLVENRVVGAPCGVMDQMTASCGRTNRLLSLLCQPAELQGHIPIPDGLALWGLDSGIRHTVSGADYGAVRVGTFMGYKILRAVAGDDLDGYLANLSPSLLAQSYRHHLPETMTGADFLRQYGESEDTVTSIDPDETYAVRQPASHPVHEHFRVRTFGRLLAGDPRLNAPQLGELMYQSHASYSACGLGSEGTDLLVSLAREEGAANGIYGAKITGGSGGTVAILGRRDAETAVHRIAERYAQITGHDSYLFAGSSPGAAAFGWLRLPYP